MNENYKITAVSYSSRTEIEDSGVVDFTNKIGVPHKEVTYLQAHISFEYMLGGKLQYGTCYRDIVKLGTVVYDTVGSKVKAVRYIPGDPIPDKSALDELYNSIVSNEYESIVIEALKDSYSQEYLNDVGIDKEPIVPVGYLTFSSPNSFSLDSNNNSQLWDGTLEYSTDTISWNTWSGNSIKSTLSDDEYTLYLRGINNTYISGDTVEGFMMFGTNISIIGNIEVLLDYLTVVRGSHPRMSDYCYSRLFRNNSSITNISGLELPATVLVDSCYRGMFQNCGQIKLSAIQIGDYQIPYRIPSSGTGVDAPSALADMFTSTGGTFTGTPTINTTYYTSNQVI